MAHQSVLSTKTDFKKTIAKIQSGVNESVAPGMVVGVFAPELLESVFTFAHGKRAKVPDELPLLNHTVFDVASLTKVVVTTSLIGLLLDRGWIQLDDPLRNYLDDFPDPRVTIDQCLKHTAGFPAWRPFYENFLRTSSVDELIKRPFKERQRAMRQWVLETPLSTSPGETCLYSDLSFLVLGFLIEELLQKPLDQCAETLIFRPMDLKNSFFKRTVGSFDQLQDDQIAATEDCPWRGDVLQGQVHDDNCWAMGGVGGHAGLFSTVFDLVSFFIQLNSGFLSRRVLRVLFERDERFGRARGWDCPSGEVSSTGSFFSPQSIGHLGFTGVSLWFDPAQELLVVLLTNRVHPSRENGLIKQFRPGLHDAVVEDLSAIKG